VADRKEFSVSVVTPDGPAYEGDAEMIIVPGVSGEIGVLARHAPLIATLKAGQHASVSGRVLSCGLRSTRRPGFKIFEALVSDASGGIRATWLNQPFLRDVFAAGQQVVLFGLVQLRTQGGLQFTNPQYELIDEEEGETIHTGRIVPIYEKTGAVTPKIQRRLVYDVLQRLPEELPDLLPEDIRVRLALPTRRAAFVAAHFPPADASIDQLNHFATPAQRRLIFEEAFLFQSGILLRRHVLLDEQKKVQIQVDDRVRASASRRSILFQTSIRRGSAGSMPSSPSTFSTSCDCAAESSCDMSRTCRITSASITSSSVARKAATSMVGRSEMKPTVSDRMTRLPCGSATARKVGSSVAKSMSADKTLASVRRLNSVDLPALV
jgi:hypothetical protein